MTRDNQVNIVHFLVHFQEGPHSTIPEDEFFDAVETGLDKIEEDRQLRVRLKFQTQQVCIYLFPTDSIFEWKSFSP